MGQYKDTYEDLLKSCNKSLYEQTSKVSTISRTMVYAVIGTIWAMTFRDGSLHMPQGWIALTLVPCAAFIIVDIVHYFRDSKFYFKTGQRIFKIKNQSKNVPETEADKYAHNSRISFIYLRAKFYLALVTIIYFSIVLIIEILQPACTCQCCSM